MVETIARGRGGSKDDGGALIVSAAAGRDGATPCGAHRSGQGVNLDEDGGDALVGVHSDGDRGDIT